MFSKFFIDRPISATKIGTAHRRSGTGHTGYSAHCAISGHNTSYGAGERRLSRANAQTVAQTVGIPIEQQVNGWTECFICRPTHPHRGVFLLTVTFAVGTDIDMATVQVQNRVSVAQSSLPAPVVVQGGVTVQKQSNNIVMFLTMKSDNKDYDGLYLSNYAKLNLVDQLTRVPGVGAVNIMGAGDYSMRIWLDPAAMRIAISHRLMCTSHSDAECRGQCRQRRTTHRK